MFLEGTMDSIIIIIIIIIIINFTSAPKTKNSSSGFSTNV